MKNQKKFLLSDIPVILTIKLKRKLFPNGFKDFKKHTENCPKETVLIKWRLPLWFGVGWFAGSLFRFLLDIVLDKVS